VPAYISCPKKLKARKVTLIEWWQNLTGTQAIPTDRQFWTLCGPLFDEEDFSFPPGCELAQLMGAGLLTPAQYHGVEIQKNIYVGNVRATARLPQIPNLYCGDFHKAMEKALVGGNFRPAIVNLDTIYEPKMAAVMLGHILHLLNQVGGVKMVVLNAIVDAPCRGPKRRFTLEGLSQAILANRHCQHHLGFGWRQSKDGWLYNGTGQTSFKMGSIAFFQPYSEVVCTK
jgi:hypothetical protein